MGESERFRLLESYEAYAKGMQYDDRRFQWHESFFNDSYIPMKDRKPSVNFNLGGVIIDRFTNLLFGYKRKPEIIVTDDSNTESYVREIARTSHIFQKMIEARKKGGACGTVIVVFSVRSGRFVIDVYNAKYCNPISWNNRSDYELELLEIKYKFEKEVPDGKGGWEEKEFWFRRLINTVEDIQFNNPSVKDGQEPDFIRDEQKSYVHNLGEFPGVWIQNLPESDDIDGVSDFANLFSIIDTINENLSGIDSALKANYSPTHVVITDNPSGVVRLGTGDALVVPTEGGDAHFLEITGDSIRIGLEYVDKLKMLAQEQSSCVLVDPDKISGAAQSAKAIEYILHAMLSMSDTLREQYGEGGILPLLKKMLKVSQQNDGRYYTDASGEIRQIVMAPSLSGLKVGTGKDIRLTWPDYFEPSPAETEQAVRAAAQAVTSNVATAEDIVRFIAQYLQIKDINKTIGAVELLLKEKRELEKKGASQTNPIDSNFPQ